MFKGDIRRFQVQFRTDDDLYTADGVEHDGKLWIVTEWDEYDPGLMKPALMIRFDHLRHRRHPGALVEYVVSEHLPRSLLDGAAHPGFDILAGQSIPFAIPIDDEPRH